MSVTYEPYEHTEICRKSLTLTSGLFWSLKVIGNTARLPMTGDGQFLPTNPVWWGSMHAISSYRGNRPTKANPPTDGTYYNTLHRSVVCKFYILILW